MGKKGNDTESFTGIMHMELCEKVDDDVIGPALSADVYDDLLVDVQVLDGTWQDLGNILGSVVTLGKSVHGGECLMVQGVVISSSQHDGSVCTSC